MKEIQTAEKRRKKESRNKLIVGLILIALMVFSTVGYALYYRSDEEQETEKYNGLSFVKNGFWQTNIYENKFSFSFHPKETENVEVNINKRLSDYANKPLYFVNNNAGLQEIARNLEKFVLRMQMACYESCEEELPIKNCTDNLIIFEESVKVEISEKDNCVFIKAPDSEIVRVSDAFVYRLLGIR